jgi:hypothetical protein
MLFNPSWNGSNVWDSTLDDLISWLRTKPSSGTYDYTDNMSCLLCQYLIDHGVNRPRVTPREWGGIVAKKPWHDMSPLEKIWSTLFKSKSYPLSGIFDDIARGARPVSGRWTYGGALKRALAHRNQQAKQGVERQRAD